jgi:tetratricopeptide (TPR) repeat protein
LLAAIAAAQDSRPTTADRAAPSGRIAFDATLKAAQDAAAQGKFEVARDQVTEMLRAHANADYAFARKTEIVELVRQCCFAIQCPDPDPKSVISGDLLAWDAETGAIKVRYRTDRLDDWQEGRMRAHPIRWNGPYSIEVKGSRYPGTDGDGLQVLVNVCDEGAIAALPGAFEEWPGINGPERHWVSSRLTAIDRSGEKSILARNDRPPCRAGQPYAVRVRVDETGVEVTWNGQSVLSGPRGKCWGHAAFKGGAAEEVILEGKAEGSWIQGLVDQAREKNRADFARTFSLSSALPEWLGSGRPAASRPSSGDVVAEWPDDLTPAQVVVAGLVMKHLSKRDLAAGIQFIENLKPGELPEATKGYLLAQFYEDTDRLDEAEALLDKVNAAAPKYWPADVVRGRIFARTGRAEQAADLLEKLVEAVPTDCDLPVEAARASLQAGQATKAKSIVDAALTRGVGCDALDHVNTMLVKAINGPPWPKRFGIHSPNFCVSSDIDQKTCEDASRMLEESYLIYSTALERVPRSGADRFRVYLFSGEAGYQAWIKDIIGDIPPHTAGIYSPVLKCLLIWNLPSREDMLQTARHEGFHQYLDRLIPCPPVWFNEGLAEYFETARMENGTLKPPQYNLRYLEYLQTAPLLPLQQFLFETQDVFYAHTESRYAQAWALVTYLRHSTPENKQLFQKLWCLLRKNVGANAAITRTFTPADMARLDRELAAWVTAKH